MLFTETRLKGAYIIDPERLEDERGFFARTWDRQEFEAHGLNSSLAQCNISYNARRGTLRGMHYQAAPHEETKLVRIHEGDAVTVTLMGESRQIRGHVESIALGIADRDRSTGANLLPNVNPTFNWVRLAQRIPVRVQIDQVPRGVRLVAGQTATVEVDAS